MLKTPSVEYKRIMDKELGIRTDLNFSVSILEARR